MFLFLFHEAIIDMRMRGKDFHPSEFSKIISIFAFGWKMFDRLEDLSVDFQMLNRKQALRFSAFK